MPRAHCPHCGHFSTDAEFCDSCNRELESTKSDSYTLPERVDFGDGTIIDCPFAEFGWPDQYPLEPLEFRWTEGRSGRLYMIAPRFWGELQAFIEERARTRIPALPPIRIAPVNGGAVILAENWLPQNDADLSQHSQSDAGLTRLKTDVRAVLDRARLLGGLMTNLHDHGLVWLNFHPSAIEAQGSAARITNLDTILFHNQECPNQLRISPRFSPPEVCRFLSDRIGPASDVFHLAMFLYYAFAQRQEEGFGGRGLEAFSFKIPPLRIYNPNLPAGIWPAIQRGLNIDPAERFASVTELLDELESVVDRGSSYPRFASGATSPSHNHPLPPSGDAVDLEQQPQLNPTPKQHPNSVDHHGGLSARISEGYLKRAEIGSKTITGTAKSAIGGVNQDAVATETIESSDRQFHILIVADGVSISRIGRGEIASQTACRVIMDTIREEILNECPTGNWGKVFERACLQATAAILEIAQSELDMRVPVAGAVADCHVKVADNDIMSTTAVIGVWDGQTLHLGNIGDSRAYLLSHGRIEQLTVDGDVGTSLLVGGVPPEQVQELGVVSKALRYCLGACTIQDTGDVAGRLEPRMDRCQPNCTSFVLDAGDILVFCTDGLVEEGVFLEPQQLNSIIRTHGSQTAQELAETLVLQADQIQRLPSPREPSGYGDNIACIVMRIGSGAP